MYYKVSPIPMDGYELFNFQSSRFWQNRHQRSIVYPQFSTSAIWWTYTIVESNLLLRSDYTNPGIYYADWWNIWQTAIWPFVVLEKVVKGWSDNKNVNRLYVFCERFTFLFVYRVGQKPALFSLRSKIFIFGYFLNFFWILWLNVRRIYPMSFKYALQKTLSAVVTEI